MSITGPGCLDRCAVADKINTKSQLITAALNQTIGLGYAKSDMQKVVYIALGYDWTRDPFDRLLTAETADIVRY